jgi:hypothetical protein
MLFVFVDLGFSINWVKDYMVFVDRNTALVSLLKFRCHNALATTAFPIFFFKYPCTGRGGP